MATTVRPGKVSDGRKAASGILVVIGTFVLFASLGAASWVLTALGVALIGGGITLFTVSYVNRNNPTVTVRRLPPRPAPAPASRGYDHDASNDGAPDDDVLVTAASPYIEMDLHDPAAARYGASGRAGGREPATDFDALGDLGADRSDLSGLDSLPDLDGLPDLDSLPDFDAPPPPRRPAPGRPAPATDGGDDPHGDPDAGPPEWPLRRPDPRGDDLGGAAGAGAPSAGTNPLPGAGRHDNRGSSGSFPSEAAFDFPEAGDMPADLPYIQRIDFGATDLDVDYLASPEPPPPPSTGTSRRKPSPRPRRPADDADPPAPRVIEAAAHPAEASIPTPRTDPDLDEEPEFDRGHELDLDLDGPPAYVTGAPSPAGPELADPRPAEPEPVGPPAPAIRIVRLNPAQPAVAALPAPDPGGQEQVSTAYQRVNPPPGTTGGVPTELATLTVGNLGTAVAFYRDLLGLVQEHVGTDRALLRCGTVHLTLVVDRARKPVRAALIHLMLEVDDVPAAYDSLRARGVRFAHEPRVVSRHDELELWSAVFRDPDGHGLALTKWEVSPG